MITTTIKNPDRVRRKHDLISEAAVKLIREKGFSAMTMRDLSRATNIGLGNLYAYLGSKDDVLFLVHENASAVLARSAERSAKRAAAPRERLRSMIEAEFDIKDAYQDLVMVMYREAHNLERSRLQGILRRELARLAAFESVIRQGIADRVFRPVRPEAVAHGIVSMVDGWVLRRWAIRHKLPAAAMKAHIVETVFAQLDAGSSSRPRRTRTSTRRAPARASRASVRRAGP